MHDSHLLVKVESWFTITNFLIHGHIKNCPCELNCNHIHHKQTFQLGYNILARGIYESAGTEHGQ
jgi:hypothetical protein